MIYVILEDFVLFGDLRLLFDLKHDTGCLEYFIEIFSGVIVFYHLRLISIGFLASRLFLLLLS